VISDLVAGLTGLGFASASDQEASGGFMASLPDPMKLELGTLLFIIGVLIVLFVFLKFVLFKPLTRLMDERETAIRAGGDTKSQAAAQIEARQADYAAQLRSLRAQAFEKRKALATEAGQERQRLVAETRVKANTQREAALAELKAGQEAAKTDLLTQVDALSESMVQHLLKQA
jgi:F-type H+-transporting ATPase subunit b